MRHIGHCLIHINRTVLPRRLDDEENENAVGGIVLAARPTASDGAAARATAAFTDVTHHLADVRAGFFFFSVVLVLHNCPPPPLPTSLNC